MFRGHLYLSCGDIHKYICIVLYSLKRNVYAISIAPIIKKDEELPCHPSLDCSSRSTKAGHSRAFGCSFQHEAEKDKFG